MASTALDSEKYKRTTRERWDVAAAPWRRWGEVIEQWLGEATELMSAGLDEPAKAAVWSEIESELERFEGPDGFAGPCELLVAGAIRS